MREKKATNFRIFLIAIVSNALTITILLLVCFIFFDAKFISLETCKLESNPNFKNFCFYSEKWNESTYISAVTSFYSTVITILVSLQALITWLSFIVIKNSHKNHIETEIQSNLPRLLNDSLNKKETKDLISNEIEILVSNIIDEKNKELIIENNSLNERIEKITEFLENEGFEIQSFLENNHAQNT